MTDPILSSLFEKWSSSDRLSIGREGMVYLAVSAERQDLADIQNTLDQLVQEGKVKIFYESKIYNSPTSGYSYHFSLL